MLTLLTGNEFAEAWSKIPRNWVKVTDVRAGDRLVWWTNLALVTRVVIGEEVTAITLDDEGKTKTFSYRNTDHLDVYPEDRNRDETT